MATGTGSGGSTAAGYGTGRQCHTDGGQGPRLCALGHITAADPSLVFRCSISGGSIMQQAAPVGQAQRSRKNSVLVAGLGAAFVASAVTCVLMMSNPSPSAVPDQAAATAVPQCQLVMRQFLVHPPTARR